MEKKILIKNAKIWTADANQPWASEILIGGDRIMAVGDRILQDCKRGICIGKENCKDKAKVSAQEEHVTIIDAEGKMIVPAFIDSHMHPIMAAKTMWCFLLEQREYDSLEEILEIVRNYCNVHPKEEAPYLYVYTCPSELMDADHVSCHLVDQYVNDRPVIICDSSFHRCLTNSLMLELMEISADTPYNPSATGNYERFANGTPNGFISERVHEFNHDLDKMFDKIGWWPPSEDDPEVLRPMFDILTGFGLTCLHDGFADSEKTLIGVKALERQGKLNHYFHTMPAIDINSGDIRKNAEAAIAQALEWGRKYNSHYITVDSVKLFLDGTNEIGTSAVLEPFVNTENDFGKINATEEELVYILERINQEGLSIQIHLVGDRAFRIALNAFEKAVASEEMQDREYESRVTLLHCELTKPEDRLRTVRKNLFINNTPTFNAGAFGDEARIYLGDERFESMFAFNDMIRYGAIVNCSSDFVDEESVPEANPMLVIEAGRRRTLTDDAHIRPMKSEQMSLEDLLRGYTIYNAMGVGRADTIGSLEPGKYANLCILSDNLFEIAPERIGKTKVEQLMFEGRFLSCK